MRIGRRILLFLFLAGTFQSGTLSAQEFTIAVVNANEIVTESAPGRIALAQLEAADAERSQVLVALQADMTEKREAYEAQRRALAPEILAEREQELVELNTRFAREEDSYRSDMESKYQELLQPVLNLTNEVLEAYRVEQGYSMIVDPFAMQGFVLALDPSFEVTAEIIERVNEVWAGGQGGAEPTPW